MQIYCPYGDGRHIVIKVAEKNNRTIAYVAPRKSEVADAC